MPGLPMNPLNSIEGHYQHKCNGLFPQPGGGLWRQRVGSSLLCRGAMGSTGLKSLSWQVPRELKEECAAPLGGGHQGHRSRRQRNKQ